MALGKVLKPVSPSSDTMIELDDGKGVHLRKQMGSSFFVPISMHGRTPVFGSYRNLA